MTKSLLLLTFVLASSRMAVADTASVNFATGPSAGLPTSLVVGSGQSGFDAAGIHSADYVAQLLYSTDGNSFSALGSPQPFFNVATTSVRAGVWKATRLDFPPNVEPGDLLELKVAVWDATLFKDWAGAEGFISESRSDGLLRCLIPGIYFQMGISTKFQYIPPSEGDLNPADYNMAKFTGFNLIAYTVGLWYGPAGCPEPSVLAMGAIGFGFLAWRWKRD